MNYDAVLWDFGDTLCDERWMLAPLDGQPQRSITAWRGFGEIRLHGQNVRSEGALLLNFRSNHEDLDAFRDNADTLSG